MNDIFKRNIITVLFLLTGTFLCHGQEIIPIETPDTLFIEPADSITRKVLQEADSLVIPPPEELIEKEAFKPNPTRAVLYSIVPGLGQIYNRKYWKLPILYGGLMGCAYAITWNHKNYSDYSQAYWGITREDPWAHKDEWKDFVSSINVNDEEAMRAKALDANFVSQLKSRKDYFRRYRDMSIFIAVGVYVLGILDAYVDAHLFDFDISPDLSMRVEPAITPANGYSPHVYGINCSIKF